MGAPTTSSGDVAGCPVSSAGVRDRARWRGRSGWARESRGRDDVQRCERESDRQEEKHNGGNAVVGPRLALLLPKCALGVPEDVIAASRRADGCAEPEEADVETSRCSALAERE